LGTKDVHKGLTCEQAEIALGVKVSTLEVTVGQQAIQIKKLQQRIDELEYTDTDEVLIEADIDLGDGVDKDYNS
tara:strand:- start:984 stop:1205 length:222 start_codon:yes stop_codon:yes gene_type:complete